MPAPYSSLPVALESFKGVNLCAAADQVKPGEWVYCQNATMSISGQLSTRAGSTRVGPATGVSGYVHSIFYLSDKVSTYPILQYLYVLGIGTSIYGWSGGVAWTQLATGFSGNPLTGVIYRLSGTGQPWLIIGDSNKMVKVAYLGGTWTVYGLGITPPDVIPNVTVLTALTLNIPNPTFAGGPVVTGASSSTGDDCPLSSLVRTNGVVTATAASSTDYKAGMPITIGSSTPALIGVFDLASVSSPTFTYVQPGPDISDLSFPTASTGIQATTNTGATSTISQAESINLSEIDGNPSTTSDSIYAWIYLDNTTHATNVQLLFDIDPGSVSGGALTATAFTLNYYVVSVYSQLSNGWNLVSVPKASFARVGQGVYDWSGVQAWQVKCVAGTGDTPTYGVAQLYLQGAAYPNTSVGVGYDWRYTDYNPVTQSESNPSPVMAVDAYPVNQAVGLLPGEYSTDPQVTQLRWYRRGGTLSSNWYLVGAQANAPPVAITSVTENNIGQYAVYVTATPHGLADGSTVYIQGVANAAFNGWEIIIYLSPTSFRINNTIAGANTTSSGGTVQAAFIDASSDTEIAAAPVLSLQNDMPVTTINEAGTIVYGQPLPYIWGPYSGVTIFGDGDPNQPGNMYWCDPTSPDSWGSLNYLEITQSSDPLTLGVTWQGNPYARSMEGQFQVVPGQAANSFSFNDIGSGESVATPWALLGGSGIPFMPWVGKSGIFIGSGGVGQSLTDDRLWPLFDPKSTRPDAVNWSAPQFNRLAWYDHHLFWIYQGKDGTLRGYRFNNDRGYWDGPHTWAFGLTCVFVQPEVQETLLLGANDGNLYSWDTSNATDNGAAIVPLVQTQAFPVAGWENDCEWGHINVDAQAPVGGIVVSASFNSTLTNYTPVGTCVATTRATTPMGLGDTYSIAASFQFTWSGAGSLFGFSVLYRNDGQKITRCETPATSYGQMHYQHLYKASICLRSTGVVNFTAVCDNVPLPPQPIPSTNNTRLRQDIYVGLNKFQVVQVVLQAATPNQGFKVYPEDCSMELQGWDAINHTEVQLPFTGGFSQ